MVIDTFSKGWNQRKLDARCANVRPHLFPMAVAGSTKIAAYRKFPCIEPQSPVAVHCYHRYYGGFCGPGYCRLRSGRSGRCAGRPAGRGRCGGDEGAEALSFTRKLRSWGMRRPRPLRAGTLERSLPAFCHGVRSGLSIRRVSRNHQRLPSRLNAGEIRKHHRFVFLTGVVNDMGLQTLPGI